MMKKQFTRTLIIILVIAIGFTTMAIAAETRASSFIRYSSASASASSNGVITISFSITGTGTMTEIGATKIELKNSSGTILKTYYCSAFQTMMGYNRNVYASSVTYPGVIGTSYYAVVYFKAANSSGGDTAAVTTYLVTAK